MARVAVSAARLTSMLQNRHRTVDDLAFAVPTVAEVHEFADGDVVLDLPDLEAIARFFKRPWSYLLIDEPETPPAIGRDHRRRVGPISELSDELLEALRSCDEQLELIIDVFPDELMEQVSVDINTGSREAAGAALRRFLDVTDDDQLRPRDEFAALRMWIEAVDRRGIYVAQRKLNDASVRAFSLLREGHALAVVDTGDAGWSRSFSLLHEVVHLQMRSAGICDLDERSGVERWCNSVAAAILMPPSLLAHANLAVLRARANLADEALRQSARQLGVSQQALLLRCRELHIITEELFADLELRWAQRRAAERQTRGGDFYLNTINRAGRRFTRQVLGALDDVIISGQEAASALQVREHQLLRLRQHL